MKPSARGEYEITDVNSGTWRKANSKSAFSIAGLPGLIQDLWVASQASQYVEVIEQRQGLKIGCIEKLPSRWDLSMHPAGPDC